MRHTQLRSFYGVAREGGFTAAARALRVTQPTVTTQVRSLEDEFGVELFIRRSGRLQLTEVGEALLAICQRIFTAEKEAQEFLAETQELKTGHLKVGAVGPYHVTEMLAGFNQRYPGVQVSVVVGNSQQMAQDVLDYKADVAVLAHIDDDPRLLAVPYSRHPVVLFAHREHRLARHRSVPIAALEGEGVIVREVGSTTRRAFEGALSAHGVHPRIVMEIGSREAIREAVAKGIGLGVVSEAEFIPDPQLRVIGIADATVDTWAHVVCLKERRNTRIVRAFLDVVGELLETRTGGGPRRKGAARPVCGLKSHSAVPRR